MWFFFQLEGAIQHLPLVPSEAILDRKLLVYTVGKQGIHQMIAPRKHPIGVLLSLSSSPSPSPMKLTDKMVWLPSSLPHTFNCIYKYKITPYKSMSISTLQKFTWLGDTISGMLLYCFTDMSIKDVPRPYSYISWDIDVQLMHLQVATGVHI